MKRPFALIVLVLILADLAMAAGPQGAKYQAPKLKTSVGKVGGHRTQKGPEGTEHASRYRVQEELDAQRDVASEQDKKGMKDVKSRNPSSDVLPTKAKKKAKVQYWHVTK